MFGKVLNFMVVMKMMFMISFGIDCRVLSSIWVILNIRGCGVVLCVVMKVIISENIIVMVVLVMFIVKVLIKG